jgi:hypothetical protein
VNEGAGTLCSTAGLRVDVDARVELGVVACAGTGDLIRVLAKITSSSVGVGGAATLCSTAGLRLDVDADDALGSAACAGAGAVVPI